MKTIDEIIQSKTTAAVEAAIKPLVQQIAALNAAIAEMTKAAKQDAGAPERLITQKEAKARLCVNDARFREMLRSGCFVAVHTARGRSKVIESTLNDYIASLRMGA